MSTPGNVFHGKTGELQAGATGYTECSQWTLRQESPTERRTYFGAAATHSRKGIPTYTGSAQCKVDVNIPPEDLFGGGDEFRNLKLYESSISKGASIDNFWQFNATITDWEITVSTEATNTFTFSFENYDDDITKPARGA